MIFIEITIIEICHLNQAINMILYIRFLFLLLYLIF